MVKMKDYQTDNRVLDDMSSFLDVLPDNIREMILATGKTEGLLEVVLDLGRPPECRFPSVRVELFPDEVTHQDIQHVVNNIGGFGDDNRAGIEHTLHRISAIKNRQGRIIGLTCRVGRAVFGTMNIIEDLTQNGESVLLLGKPGVGKTTMLRELARVLADGEGKRVVIVDTSNEIAGDGDIPHPAIGSARRMHVSTPSLQHAVMIEAVENHMPEVIIIDEMGTEQEAAAARTIAERGVQLIATAHGNTLNNLILNPTLCDLVGGIQTVTLGDEEAKRRKTRKSVLERKFSPTFQVVVEIQNWDQVGVHRDIGKVVDTLLRGQVQSPETRWVDEDGLIQKSSIDTKKLIYEEKEDKSTRVQESRGKLTNILPFGINRGRVIQLIQSDNVPVHLVDKLEQADVVITTKQFFRTMPKLLKKAEETGKSIFVLRRNSSVQIREFLQSFVNSKVWLEPMDVAMKEASEAAKQIEQGKERVILNPQTAFVRRLQHQIAQDLRLSSVSVGEGPDRRVTISKR